MKIFPPIILGLALLLGCPFLLSAQFPGAEPDQVALLKRFVGTWEGEIGADTLLVLHIIPNGTGLYFTREVKVHGNVVNRYSGMYGLSQDKKTIIAASVTEDGSMYIDYGRFISDYEYVAEMYTDDLKHPVAMEEIEFQSPDSFLSRSRWRGDQMSWDAPWSPMWSFRRID
jgi:hypothetical protein